MRTLIVAHIACGRDETKKSRLAVYRQSCNARCREDAVGLSYSYFIHPLYDLFLAPLGLQPSNSPRELVHHQLRPSFRAKLSRTCKSLSYVAAWARLCLPLSSSVARFLQALR